MGSSSDDFEGLRTLLKVKRYEQPPPRYFDDLSHGVLGRLRGPDGLREQSLVSSLGLGFLLRPALFYAVGLACCGMAFFAVVSLMAGHPESAEQNSQSSALLSGPTVAEGPVPAKLEPAAGALGSEPGSASIQSTNPVLTPADSSFAINPFRLRPTPVSFRQP